MTEKINFDLVINDVSEELNKYAPGDWSVSCCTCSCSCCW